MTKNMICSNFIYFKRPDALSGETSVDKVFHFAVFGSRDDRITRSGTPLFNINRAVLFRLLLIG